MYHFRKQESYFLWRMLDRWVKGGLLGGKEGGEREDDLGETHSFTSLHAGSREEDMMGGEGGREGGRSYADESGCCCFPKFPRKEEALPCLTNSLHNSFAFYSSGTFCPIHI